MFDVQNEFVSFKSNRWFERQKIAGAVLAVILKDCTSLIESSENIPLKELEQIAIKHIENNDCIATFKGYYGFPSAICTSVNNQLVHGIVTDYIVKKGDLVTVDVGVTYKGAIADAAYTSVCGKETKDINIRMLQVCQGALQAGISAIKVGARLGVIGNAIHKYAKDTEFGLITKYGGHGLDWDKPHAKPFVANRATPYEGIRIQPGLAIAIEPMLVIGSTDTKVLSDKWTVVTPGLGCHFEHSIFVQENGEVSIITDHGMKI